MDLGLRNGIFLRFSTHEMMTKTFLNAIRFADNVYGNLSYTQSLSDRLLSAADNQ